MGVIASYDARLFVVVFLRFGMVEALSVEVDDGNGEGARWEGHGAREMLHGLPGPRKNTRRVPTRPATTVPSMCGPVVYTFRKSLLLPMLRDVTYRQRKCLCMLACGTFGADLNCSESEGVRLSCRRQMARAR
jgi:hypothetical protein